MDATLSESRQKFALLYYLGRLRRCFRRPRLASTDPTQYNHLTRIFSVLQYGHLEAPTIWARLDIIPIEAFAACALIGRVRFLIRIIGCGLDKLTQCQR